MKAMKKTLAILLCLAMCLSMMPTWALAEAPETDAALMSEEPTAEVMQEPIPEEVTPDAPPQEPSEEVPEEVVLQEEIPEPEEQVNEEPEPENETYFEAEAVSDEGSGEEGTTGNDTSPVEEPAEMQPNTVTNPEEAGETLVESSESQAEPESVADPVAENPEAAEAVTVIFRISPENAELIVYTKDNPEHPGEKTVLDPEEDGSYLLLPGTYYYALTAEGYMTVEEETLLVMPSEEPVKVEAVMTPVDGQTEEEKTEAETEEAVLQAEEKTEETAVLMASSGTCGDNLTWTLDDTGTLTISGTGAMNHYSDTTPSPWPKSIHKVVIKSGVTSIGNWAFRGCNELLTATIPNTVTIIGDYTFETCFALNSIRIPDSVTNIGENAFAGCTSLTRITIPGSVINVKDWAFMGCSSLESVQILDGVMTIGSSFYSCTSLTSVTIPDSVTEIGGNIFANCSNLRQVAIPEDVEIPTFGFYKCTSLASITIPKDTTGIGYYAFYGCSSLRNVTIPVGILAIGGSAFEECSNLNTVIFQGDAPIINDAAFKNVTSDVYYPKSGNWAVSDLQNYGGKLSWHMYKKTDLDTSKRFLAVGESTVLQVGGQSDVTWRSSDDNIASVDRNGIVSAKKVGTVNISADPIGAVTVEIQVLFEDVKNSTAYFYEPVYWAVDNGITTGRSDTSFDPYGQCTRGHIVTFLWRAMGKQEPTISNPFADISPNDSFYKAVLWAYEKGITTGQTPTTFGPWNFCTRGQIVTFLWRAMGQAEPSIGNPFEDVNPGDGFYRAVLWAVENGITTGRTPTTFDPWATCTRGQAVTFLYRAQNVNLSFPEAYIVSYNATGGYSAPKSQIKYQGQNLVLSLDSPVRADESINSYTITLDANGGSVSQRSITSKKTVTYSFKNWNTKADGTGTVYIPGANYTANADVTLYAQWERRTSSTGAVILPTPTYNHYVFKGWSTSGNASQGVIGSYVPSENVTLYAIWEEIEKYTISYDANGGKDAPYSQVKYKGETLRLTTTKPVRSSISSGSFFTITLDANGGNASLNSIRAYETIDYAFKNWNTQADGNGTSYATGASYLPDESVTLYAQWNSDKSAPTVELPTLTRNYYTFRGWSTNRAAVYGSRTYTPTSDVTLYAIWKEEYTASGTWDNLSWKLYNDGLLRISGKGKMKDFDYVNYEFSDTYAGTWKHKQYRDLITSVVLDPGITSISSYAFSDCSNLASISIPAGVTKIGWKAFCGCSALTDITLPESITEIHEYAFSDCRSLTEIVIPYGIPYIAWYTFKGCENLTSVTIPDSAEYISTEAFSGCKSLTYIDLPDNLISIDDQAFIGCTGLTSIIIPEGVTRIGRAAFHSCSSLKSVTIPGSVTTFRGEAFVSCPHLEDVYYGGTEAQWQTLTSGLNDDLKNATIHYNSVT